VYVDPVIGEEIALVDDENLHFTADVESAIADADMIFVSVNTPTKMFGRGAGRAADLQWTKPTPHWLHLRA